MTLAVGAILDTQCIFFNVSLEGSQYMLVVLATEEINQMEQLNFIKLGFRFFP